MAYNFDEHENDCSKAGRNGGGHAETSKDGTKARSLVPTPFDILSSYGGNTNASDR